MRTIKDIMLAQVEEIAAKHEVEPVILGLNKESFTLAFFRGDEMKFAGQITMIFDYSIITARIIQAPKRIVVDTTFRIDNNETRDFVFEELARVLSGNIIFGTLGEAQKA